jgi:hypothetical protein
MQDTGFPGATAMRLPRIKLWRLIRLVVVVAVLLGGAVQAWRESRLLELRRFKRQCVFGDFDDLTKDFGDFTKVPLDQSPFLRDAAEPISLIGGTWTGYSGDGCIYISFADQKNVKRNARYVFCPRTGGDISDQLMLDQKAVSPHDPEEQAFLGLLQRWYLGDAEAREFHDHLKGSDVPKLTDQQKGKVMGVAILRKLLTRK